MLHNAIRKVLYKDTLAKCGCSPPKLGLEASGYFIVLISYFICLRQSLLVQSPFSHQRAGDVESSCNVEDPLPRWPSEHEGVGAVLVVWRLFWEPQHFPAPTLLPLQVPSSAHPNRTAFLGWAGRNTTCCFLCHMLVRLKHKWIAQQGASLPYPSNMFVWGIPCSRTGTHILQRSTFPPGCSLGLLSHPPWGHRILQRSFLLEAL